MQNASQQQLSWFGLLSATRVTVSGNSTYLSSPSVGHEPLGGLRSGFYQLEQEGRKMRGGVEECSSTVMLQHHHTSHCPFEWSCYPPASPPSTHQLNLDANNPPSSYSSPALSLSPSLSSLSLTLIVRCHTCLHGNRSGIGCCSCDLSGSWSWTNFFFSSPHPPTSSPLSCTPARFQSMLGVCGRDT